MKTTNVEPSDLNYDHYTSDQYDRDIANSIPFHREMHIAIVRYARDKFKEALNPSVIDLGVGTGITSKLIQEELPQADFDLVDFSTQMLEGARKKFGDSPKANYVLGDYSEMEFDKKYDLAVSVIGLHHQTHEGKRFMFEKIYSLLKPQGTFIFGDLVTYRDQKKAAFNQARHFHHLTEKAADEKALEEWAYHHYKLNNPAPIEDQIDWLEESGFKVKTELLEINTALLLCEKH